MYVAIRKGLIRINGKRAALNYRTAAGDILSIAASLLSAGKQPAQQKSLADKQDYIPNKQAYTLTDIPILLKATDLLIINKPAGISVHGRYSIEAMLSSAWALVFSDEQSAAIGSDGKPPQSLSFKQGPLHRLDKNTTGVLCFSRTLAGAQWFSQCLREKTVDKYYLGIVRGAMSTRFITAEDESGKTMTQCYSAGYNKDIDASLMLFRLITGKKHQIRKHTMSIGHPLAGDSKYRGEAPLSGCARYQLHAWRLYFPASRPADVPAYIEAPLFPEMSKCLNKYFSDWEKRTEAIFTNQIQATDNF